MTKLDDKAGYDDILTEESRPTSVLSGIAGGS